ncbi:hypothetical protein [Variovorax sp. Sphag1AA]|uniref:hypothetical protein n=1 Tax=Variovorax sp. Sphag1AA TaxID=2587027 RepID=UPI00161FF0B7|nr:hypothetical protein [Variovorax sp. Sphag1AA]MBB3181358.1 hypothetical protein [Variovorax sp. Sphag1AA]
MSASAVGAAPRTAYRTWPATLAILVAITVYVGGLQLWDRLTLSTRLLPEGEPVLVGQARFVPAEGWLMNVSRSRPGQRLVLFKNGHTFSVTTSRWLGGPEGPLERQQRLIERGQHLHVEGDVSKFLTDWGLEGTTFAYYGPKLSGRFWLMVDPARASVVQVDFYGPNDNAASAAEALDDARHMLASMDLEAS